MRINYGFVLDIKTSTGTLSRRVANCYESRVQEYFTTWRDGTEGLDAFKKNCSVKVCSYWTSMAAAYW